jgi:hypothetical protein
LSALPAALTSGFVTAALAGVLLFACAVAGGHGRNVDALLDAVRWPLWQVFVPLVVTLPWLTLGAAAAGRVRRSIRRPASGRMRWLTARRLNGPVTGLAVALFGLALVGDAVPPLSIGPHDWTDYLNAATAAQGQAPAVAATPSDRAPTPDPNRRGDAGRPLDDAAATAVLATIAPLLPAGYQRVDDDSSNDTTVNIRPDDCRDVLRDNENDERALPRTAEVGQQYTVPLGPQPEAKLRVGIISFTTPIPDFTRYRNETTRCNHLTMPLAISDTGLMEGSYTEGVPPHLSYPTYRTDFTLTGSVRSVPVVTTWLADYALVGHNRLSVSIILSTLGGPPSDDLLRRRDQLAETILRTIIEKLQATAPR